MISSLYLVKRQPFDKAQGRQALKFRFPFLAAWRRRSRILKLTRQVAELRAEQQRLYRWAYRTDLLTLDTLLELDGLRARRLMLEGVLRRELGN